MTELAALFIAVGGLLLVSLLVNVVGQRTFLPRITLLLVLGLLVGENGFDLLPPILINGFTVIADFALLMVGFLMGGKLTFSPRERHNRQAFWISLFGALLTAAAVSVVCLWVGASPDVAVLLGAIASATAPAAIYDVISESRFNGPYANTLLTVVALDDVWALLLFGVCVAIASSINGQHTNGTLLLVAWDLGGAVVLGLLIGLPASALTGRIKPGQPMLVEAIGCVFLCGGLALWCEVSILISAMVVGMCIANFARHHDYPFHEIENIEWPFMVVFFVVAGATLQFNGLYDMGLISGAYISSRLFGKWFGCYVGGTLCQASQLTRRWLGLAMLPQAGVGIGLALAVSRYFPDYHQLLLSVVVSTTIFFELVGPILTRWVLLKAQKQELA